MNITNYCPVPFPKKNWIYAYPSSDSSESLSSSFSSSSTIIPSEIIFYLGFFNFLSFFFNSFAHCFTPISSLISLWKRKDSVSSTIPSDSISSLTSSRSYCASYSFYRLPRLFKISYRQRILILMTSSESLPSPIAQLNSDVIVFISFYSWRILPISWGAATFAISLITS
jgi:hypothetical protein